MMPAPKFPQYKTVPTASLIPYVRNARTHSPQQVDKIAASIREFGFLSPIITDGQSGIVAGHGRVMAAQKLGLDTLPTIDAAHLTEAQRRAAPMCWQITARHWIPDGTTTCSRSSCRIWKRRALT